MAQSIVLELQAMAADRSNDVTDLLRKALMVATKLKLDDFKAWVNCELHGYAGGVEVPPYRNLRAEMKVFNPYRGLQPLHMPADLEKRLASITYRAAIGNAVSILELHKQGNHSSPEYPFTVEQRNALMEGMDSPMPMEPKRIVSETQLDMVVDAVRSTVLEWALKLEETGILGDGLTFSQEEKQRAATSQQIHIGGNFQGILGSIGHSQVEQHLSMQIAKGDLGSLRRYLEAKGVDASQIGELAKAIESDPIPATGKYGPAVSKWIGTMMNLAASGAWGVSIDTAGGLLSQAIAAYYGL